MNRDILSRINYFLVLIMLISVIWVIRYYESPERLIEGKWEERAWSLEKDNAGKEIESNGYLQANLRREILKNIEDLHFGTWSFNQDGSLTSGDPKSGELEWLIKGRGHILEIRRAGVQVESFQIQQISADKMVLHLNFDLQVKGVIEIVLQRMEKKESYATKI